MLILIAAGSKAFQVCGVWRWSSRHNRCAQLYNDGYSIDRCPPRVCASTRLVVNTMHTHASHVKHPELYALLNKHLNHSSTDISTWMIFLCRYDLVQADLAVGSFNELSVINLRRLFANKGSTFMDLQKQSAEKAPSKRKLTIDTIFWFIFLRFLSSFHVSKLSWCQFFCWPLCHLKTLKMEELDMSLQMELEEFFWLLKARFCKNLSIMQLFSLIIFFSTTILGWWSNFLTLKEEWHVNYRWARLVLVHKFCVIQKSGIKKK